MHTSIAFDLLCSSDQNQPSAEPQDFDLQPLVSSSAQGTCIWTSKSHAHNFLHKKVVYYVQYAHQHKCCWIRVLFVHSMLSCILDFNFVSAWVYLKLNIYSYTWYIHPLFLNFCIPALFNIHFCL